MGLPLKGEEEPPSPVVLTVEMENIQRVAVVDGYYEDKEFLGAGS